MARPENDLNPTAASLLGFLQGGEATGYELVAIAEAVIGDFWSLTRSQVYRELTTLAERGLVRAGTTGPRSRQPYRLTPAGRAAFRAWMRQPPGLEQIRYPLLAHDHVRGGGGPRASARAMQPSTDASTRSASPSTGSSSSTIRIERATLAFGVHYERAVLAWMDELPGLLVSDGRKFW